jgi:hypothetical protein
MMFALAHSQAPVVMGPYEWGFVALASVIIFSILGKRLWLDLKDAS